MMFLMELSPDQTGVESKHVRRRGAALDDAMLSAAWDELLERGYANFTIEAAAERAKTSRAVIYRRWPNKMDLIIAAIRHQGEHNPVPSPDTGSLRGDLIAFLSTASEKRSDTAALFVVHMAQFFNEVPTAVAVQG